MGKKTFLLIGGAILLHFFLLFYSKFTAWPEMLAWPYFIVKGWLPYRDFAMVHTPILVLDIALFYKIFGVGPLPLKLCAWILILGTDLLLFYIAKKLWNVKVALVALFVFVPLQIFYEGNSLWFDFTLSLLALLIFYCLKTKRYVWAGVLWGVAFFTKQTAFWFLPPIALTIFAGGDFLNRTKKLAIGSLAVFALLFLIAWLFGILPDFIYWAFTYGIGILPKAAGQIDLPAVRSLVVAFSPFAIFVLGLKLDWKKYLPLGVWSFFGVMGTFPRWQMFHFQPGVPFLALAISLVIVTVKKKQRLPIVFLALYLILVSLMVFRSLARNWKVQDRFLEEPVVSAADYIRKNTKEGERIFVLNSWDSLYALADRLPASKPWFPQLSWVFSVPRVEEKVVADLKLNPPALIIMQPYTTGELSSFKPKALTDYIFKYYQPTEILEGSFTILRPYK